MLTAVIRLAGPGRARPIVRSRSLGGSMVDIPPGKQTGTPGSAALDDENNGGARTSRGNMYS